MTDSLSVADHAFASRVSVSLSPKKAAGGIDLHVNADKIKYTCFNQNQTRDISTQTGGSLNPILTLTY